MTQPFLGGADDRQNHSQPCRRPSPLSAAVVAALEQMMQDEEEREVALSVLGQEIRARIETSRAAFIDQDDASPLLVAPLARRVGRDLPDQATRTCRA